MHKTCGWMISGALILVLLSVGIACAAQDSPIASGTPSVYLNFNEGSSVYAIDSSGHGNGGTIHDAARIVNGGCGGALLFNGNDSYVSIPFSYGNHPVKEITVSLWFYTDSFDPQVLLSGYRTVDTVSLLMTGMTFGGRSILKEPGMYPFPSGTRVSHRANGITSREPMTGYIKDLPRRGPEEPGECDRDNPLR